MGRRRSKKPRDPNSNYEQYLFAGMCVFIAARMILPGDPRFADKLPLTYLICFITALATVLILHFVNRMKARRGQKLLNDKK